MMSGVGAVVNWLASAGDNPNPELLAPAPVIALDADVKPGI